MPLAVKSLPHDHDHMSDVAMSGDTSILSEFVHSEVKRALKDVERSAEHGRKRLHQEIVRADKRLQATGRRILRINHHAPLPVTPLAVGVGIILAALLLWPNKAR